MPNPARSRRPHQIGPRPASLTASRALTIVAVLGIVAALYFARAIFVPLAVAILLTFVLAPPVRLLRSWKVGRVTSVITVVTFAFLLIFGLGSVIGQQLTQLATNLPQYQLTIQEKIRTLRSTATSGSTIERVASLLRNLNQEIGSKEKASAPAAPQEDGPKPIPVEIHQQSPTPLEVIRNVLQPLLDPLTSIGLVIIFVIFFLLQREDLRDRLISLAGSYDLRRTTEAMNDGARRLSRFFLAQTALNALFGVIVGTGLAVIGVPNPVLWGVLAMLMRFVPYVGAFVAAACPVAMAVAVDPGWSMVLWTVALFLVIEPLIGHVLEPLVYGHSTGLTPVAVIVAATFWTWLWGPVGLLLSTPLTVCLGVLGRHVEGLQFLDIMIGSDAPLTPAQSFYQRALAGSVDEVVEQAEQFLKRLSLSAYYDEVVVQGLILAQIDHRRGALNDREVTRINEAVDGLIVELSDHEDRTPKRSEHLAFRADSEPGDPKPADDLPIVRPEDLPAEWRREAPALCIAGRGAFDDVATAMLAQILDKHGIRARQETDSAVSPLNIIHLDSAGVALVCLSHLDLGDSLTHLRYSIRRIRRSLPRATILAGFWGRESGQTATDDSSANSAADLYATSLRAAVRLGLEVAQSRAAQEARPPAEVGTSAA